MKLLFACGGTGGHIFPAFSAAEEIKKRHPGAEIIYICGKKDIENAIFKLVSAEKTVPIESAPYRGPLSLGSAAVSDSPAVMSAPTPHWSDPAGSAWHQSSPFEAPPLRSFTGKP